MSVSHPHSQPTLALKARRARQFLGGAGVSREDSDDELGYEDHPWEWVYEDKLSGRPFSPHKVEKSLPSRSLGNTENPVMTPTMFASSSYQQEGSESSDTDDRKIIGARMGQFQCRLGDCVLLKSEVNQEAWVGLICEFQQDIENDCKAANFMWFSTESEIRNKQKKMMDFMPYELYITPSWDVNPLTSINGKALIMSPAKFLSAYPSGKISKGSEDYGKVFICRRGCNTRTATYTNDFIWEDIYHGTEEDIFKLIERVKKETKASRKTRTEVSSRKMNREFDDKNYDALPRTPRKRRKLDGPVTPNTHGKAQNFTTPTHKRMVIKKPLEFTPLGTRVISPGQFLSSPFQIARSQLHVSSVPASLPCRETEFSTVYSHLEAAISEGSGSCIYISGTPGTGKTATVREVVSQLNASVLAEELDDFIFVEINGMKITDPHQAYSLLWEALRGDRVSPAQALGLLEREFGHPGPRRVPCVVLMDELDQLVTKNQSVMYNFFNWPSLRHSRLIVLAVANTMDLPERTLSNKISSRLGLTRITFPGYSHEQLIKIIQSRLEGVPGNVVDPDAVQFASRKVAAVSGDARRALDICRRAVEIAELESLDTEDNLPSTPSKRLKWHQQEVNGTHRTKVTIAMIKQAIHEATTSPLQQALRQLPLSSKLFLAAVLVKIRRTGIVESILSEVFEEARRMGNTTNNPNIHQYLLTDFSMINNLSSSTSRGPLAPRVISLREAATMLMESGIIGLEARKGERTGKVRLNVSEEDINLALREDMEIRGLGFSA